ncbi:hypothetical protein Tco_1524918 [Tanacetum coccineum]
MTTLHDLIAQAMQKKEEEKRIAEEQAAKERYWKIPICDDDDDNDYTIAITPVLSTEEPVNSLIMENEHLDTISATESDEFIKSSVEILVPIPSESNVSPKCDVPFHDNSPPLDISKDQSEDFSDSNADSTSTDEDSYSRKAIRKSAFLLWFNIKYEVLCATFLVLKIYSSPIRFNEVGKKLYMVSIKLLSLVKQKDDGIFISQDKYVADILKKFDFVTMKTESPPIKTNSALLKDKEDEDVDVHLYRSMMDS